MKIERLMEIVKEAIAHVKTTGPGNKPTTRTKLKGTMSTGPHKKLYGTNTRRKFGGGIPKAELPLARGNR